MRDISPRGVVPWLLIAIVAGYAAFLIIVPFAAIVESAFREGIVPFFEAITEPDALVSLRLTVLLAAAAALINTLLGVMCAWVLVRHRFPGRRFFNAIVDLPFVVSPVIIGYVMIVLFGRQGWLNWLPVQIAFSWPAMLIVTVFVSLPFVIREVQPVLAALTPEQEEAAFTLGASRWLVFRRVIFPAIRHAVIYGIVLTLARAIGEFGAAAVAGGGVQGVTETATIYIYRSLNDRAQTGAYSMSVLLGVLAIVILVLMNWLRGRSHRPAVKGDLDVDSGE